MGQPLKNPPVYFTLTQVKFNAVLKLADFLPAIQEGMRTGGFPLFEKQATFAVDLVAENGQVVPKPGVKERYLFGDIARTHVFWLDSETFTLQSTAYGNFDAFSGTFLRGLALVHDVLNLALTERIGLRYLDRVFPMADDALGDYLVPEALGMHPKLEGKVMRAYTEAVSAVEAHILVSRIVVQDGPLSFPPDMVPSDMRVDDRLAAYVGRHAILDNDGFFEGREEFSIDGVAAHLKTIHDVIYKAFKATVTPHAFKAWGKE
jgi:uncharacterized protein (TIGR04255 family)